MIVKVVKCSHDYWYKVLVGQTVEVKESTTPIFWMAINNKMLILKDDCETIDLIDNQHINDFIDSKIEELKKYQDKSFDDIKYFFEQSLRELWKKK